jgi:hypothetical protein
MQAIRNDEDAGILPAAERTVHGYRPQLLDDRRTGPPGALSPWVTVRT